MSNPTNAVAELQSDLVIQTPAGATAFSGVDPIRYDDGLWLEQGGTNLVLNPAAVTDTTGWGINDVNVPIVRVTSLPAPLPNELAGLVTTGFRMHATATSAVFAVANTGLTLTAAAYTYSGYFYIPSSYTGSAPRLRRGDFVSATGDDFEAVNLSLRDQWQKLDITFTPNAGDLVGDLRVQIGGTINSGDEFWFAAMQAELGTYPTSFALKSFGDGYSGTTTHIRAASSASVAIDEPVSVACWYREEYSGAKQFAYLDTLGQLGDYGDISYAAGDLTISTSRNLVIGPFAAFDRELTAQEQANMRSTQSWNLNTVLGRNPYINFQLRPY